MGISAKIIDSGSKLGASILKPDGEKPGFNVLSRPAKFYNNQIKFFTNPDEGINMAVNPGAQVINEWIHDGIDNAYWAAVALSGVWAFNSILWNHTPAGAQCIDASATVNGDTAQINRGAGLALNAPITALGIWLYIVSWSASPATKQILFRGWDTGTGAMVGTEVDLVNYIDVGLIGVDQQAIIPLSDMNLEGQTIDAVQVQTVKIGGGPVQQYYLDDLTILQGVVPVIYEVNPNLGTWLFIDKINISMADVYDPTLADSTMPQLRYDGFLGEAALAGGIVFQKVQNNIVKIIANIKQLFDFIKLPGSEIVGFGSDGINSWLSIRINSVGDVRLKSEGEEKLRIIINDDLSGLLEFQISVGCREEIRRGKLYT
jgi:hypothetical protein